MLQVAILGATGSIGQSTLDIIAHHTDEYQVYALTANHNAEKLLKLCQQFKPKYAVLVADEKASWLQQQLSTAKLPTELLVGKQALQQVVADTEVDIVVAAIVGAAGLLPNMAAAQAGKKILLANKEALVMSGQLFMDAVKKHGATLLPIDSEHNAIFQCLQQQDAKAVRRIILTGSGGPFRQCDVASLTDKTPDEACAHPNWDMGRKISVDSATMMNKGLEFIEACWLFDKSADEVEIVIHPQSIVHSLVEYIDGSILAQLGQADMRVPIAHALAYPKRITSGADYLNIAALSKLEFSQPDYQRFPCLAFAKQVMQTGDDASCYLNAANETAVAAFLSNKIRFTDIAKIIDIVLQQADFNPSQTLDRILQSDQQARQLAQTAITALNKELAC